MNEQEIFEYLSNNLYLDDNKSYGSQDFTIKLKLRSPIAGEHPVVLGEIDIDLSRYEQVGTGNTYRRRW